ncbi:hypothetical protein BTO01_03965 [Vibrio jasicida]|nr:hypothetical protein BTO01_03965 [Vibrio jasicida]
MNKNQIKNDIKEVVNNYTGIKVFFLDKFNNVLDLDINNQSPQHLALFLLIASKPSQTEFIPVVITKH